MKMQNNENMSLIRAMRRQKKTRGVYFQMIMCIVLLCFVVVPLIVLLSGVKVETFQTIASDVTFLPALRNSFVTALISSVLSLFIAYGLAWAVSRTKIKFITIFSIVIILPMLIPSISHGMGLVILFGNNGLITRLFGLQSFLYGYFGIIMGSILYSVPVAYLMFVDILKYENYQAYEAADILGIPKYRQFSSITMPYLRKPTISIFFTVFTMIITDYGVPISVGGKVKTLPVILYEKVVGQLDYSIGIIIGLILLVPALISFILDLINKDKGKMTYVTARVNIKKDIKRDIFGYFICLSFTLFVSLVVISFGVQAFSKSYPNDMSFTLDHFKNTISKNGLTYLDNSIIMSILTACVGTAVAFITGYCTTRLKTKLSKPIHIMSLISLSIPGLVLGLSYVIIFNSSFIYGTLTLLIIITPFIDKSNGLKEKNQKVISTPCIPYLNRN